MLACYCNIPTDKSIKQILFEGGSWCERESHEEACEMSAKVGWTRGHTGRVTVDQESACA